MSLDFKNITLENIEDEHLCCAISDKKHQKGVEYKKEWLKDRIPEGHTFRKLDENGKVFIEYSPLETAWVPVIGENYIFIHCLWVSGKFKGQGIAKQLLDYCIEDAKSQGKSGICIITSKKKKPFLSDPKFLKKMGFVTLDTVSEYELMALSFDKSASPKFSETIRSETIDSKGVTIFYNRQCPYTQNCIDQIKSFSEKNNVNLKIEEIDSLDRAKSMPAIFNNWALFIDGEFETHHLLNENKFKDIMKQKGIIK